MIRQNCGVRWATLSQLSGPAAHPGDFMKPPQHATPSSSRLSRAKNGSPARPSTKSSNGPSREQYLPAYTALEDESIDDDHLDEEAIPETSTGDIVKAHASADRCTVSGSGIEAAAVRQLAEFSIEACDAQGSRLPAGGEAFFIHIRGPQRVRARITDNQDGTYLVSWTPPQSGKYSIAVSLFGLPLRGSPFTVMATAPAPFAPKCEVRGVGTAIARATQTFEVSFRDRLGFATHAVDLDVYAELMPEITPESPEVAVAAEKPNRAMTERKGKALRGGVEFSVETASVRAEVAADASAASGAPAAAAEIEIEAAASSAEAISSGRAIEEEEEAPLAEVRRRALRVKARNAPLVIRATEDVSSAQVRPAGSERGACMHRCASRARAAEQ